MAEKVLFQTALTDLETSDVEGLGVERTDEFGNCYRWNKNKSTTALIKAAPCCKIVTSVAAASLQKVTSPDAGPATGNVKRPAGIPVTAIAASGASTGDHGWVKFEGVGRASFIGTDTARAVGMVAIATSAFPSTGCFDIAQNEYQTADSASVAYAFAFANKVQLINAPATEGAATAHSGTVQIYCR